MRWTVSAISKIGYVFVDNLIWSSMVANYISFFPIAVLRGVFFTLNAHCGIIAKRILVPFYCINQGFGIPVHHFSSIFCNNLGDSLMPPRFNANDSFTHSYGLIYFVFYPITVCVVHACNNNYDARRSNLISESFFLLFRVIGI